MRSETIGTTNMCVLGYIKFNSSWPTLHIVLARLVTDVRTIKISGSLQHHQKLKSGPNYHRKKVVAITIK